MKMLPYFNKMWDLIIIDWKIRKKITERECRIDKGL
jgi:hypothetical protein